MAIEQSQTTAIATEWIARFQAFLSALSSTTPAGPSPKDSADLGDLLTPDVAWRDLLTFSWNFRTITGLDNVRSYLGFTHGQAVGNTDNSLSERSFECLGIAEKLENETKEVNAGPGLNWIQVVFDYATRFGNGKGVVRLMLDPQSQTWKARAVYTGLESLKDQKESILSNRPYGFREGIIPSRETWKETRQTSIKYENREPEVLIIGAGHSGLMLGARLKMIGVDALIIEKNERVGDNWRNRYDSLKLHDPVWTNHYPYMPFPESWPLFPSKDKLGDWLETYSNTLELNVWTSTFLSSDASYEAKDGVWTVTVTTSDNRVCEGEKEKKRVIKPKHVVFATGPTGDPNIPNVPNRESFPGPVIHSSAFKSGKMFKGKKVAVVGACTSAIDIAQDLLEQGAYPTLVQRSSTYVLSTPTMLQVQLGRIWENKDGLPDVGDLLLHSMPSSFAMPLAKGMVRYMAQLDQKLLEDLNKAGFKTNMGLMGAGIGGLYLTRGGGYYIDVGVCQSIIDGDIKVKQGSEIVSYEKNGMKFADGTSLDFDAIVLATGWGDFNAYAEKILGPEAKRLGPVWGIDQDGEMRGNWRPTGHPALWAMLGPISMSRFFSKKLALQLKARLMGLSSV